MIVCRSLILVQWRLLVSSASGMVLSPNYDHYPDITGLEFILSISTGLSELQIRTSIDHFKQFLDEMDRRGLDLSRVHLVKGEIMLWGCVSDNGSLDCQ